MLTVVTHTRGDRPETLARAVKSVEEQLRSGISHKIIQVPNAADYCAARWAVLDLDEYVCFLDDDDWLVNDSLGEVMKVLQTQKPGLIFTCEQEADRQGRELQPLYTRDLRYFNLCEGPRAAHHLAAFRTSAITDAWKHYKVIGTGLEWMMKSEAALKQDAVHIQMVGYKYVRDGSGLSFTPEFLKEFTEKTKFVKKILHRYREDEQEKIPSVKP